jgi:WhiB family redox-sensing transcriptional regulator
VSFLSIPGDWRHRAACGGRYDDLFFPVGDTGPARTQEQQAKAICATCPVLTECRTWALNAGTDADYGIWGGLNEAERRRIRRGTIRHGSNVAYSDRGCRCGICVDAHARRLRAYRERKRRAS